MLAQLLALLPLFALQPNAFDAAGCTGAQAGCWTNYLRLTDLDGDGDLDVVFSNLGDFFGNGRQPQPLGVWLNDGAGHFTNQSASLVGGLAKPVREVAIGDIDGDGDLDLYLPDAFGGADVLFVNQGNGQLVDEAATRMPGVASHAGAVRFADVDDDGDLDLLVGDGYATNATQEVHLYLNDGTGAFVPADERLPVQGEVADANDPAFATDPDDFDLLDVDRDGDLDLLINHHHGRELLWLNDGTGHFNDASANLPLPDGNPNKYNPGVCDVDGDGDLDVWIDNSATNYLEQLLINDGQGHFTDETDARVKGNVLGADDNGVVCADVDGDGDFDAVIVALGNAERVLINDGTGHFTALAGVFPTLTGSRLWMDFGDVNGDGRLDAVTGLGESGDMIDRLSLGTADAPVDTRAPVIGAVQLSAASVLHFAVQDS
ncbi:MAG: FG-GAP repeat domain-containing protein, partial [Ilumatobacteraceae bacterium]